MQLLLSVLIVFALAGVAAAFLIRAAAGRDVRRADLDDRRRFAEEVSVAAERATNTAQRARADWLATVDAVEAAWAGFEEADARTSRLAAAAALPEPATPQTPAEYADRERYLHRAAVAAVGRSELSAEQLGDILTGRDGWDPRLHPVKQELVLNRVHWDAAFAAYRVAAERERMAWRHAEIAAVAAQSLRDEAHAARQAAPSASWSYAAASVTPVRAQAAPLRTAHAG
jgi:hypothetical protein